MGFFDKLFVKKDDNSKGLKYEDLGNGTCKVTGRGKNRDEEIEIPSEINGLKVVALGEEAFHKDEKIRAVTIPEGITEIPKSCFESCYYLRSVNLPEGLKKIGYSAFGSISSLCNVDFPDSVEEIDGLAFGGGGIKYDGIVKFPKNLKKIGHGAFWYLSHLKTIEFPDGFEEIGEAAFLACKELTDVVIPASLKKIGKRAFEKCAKLDEIRFLGTKEQWEAIEKKENWNAEAGQCKDCIIGS